MSAIPTTLRGARAAAAPVGRARHPRRGRSAVAAEQRPSEAGDRTARAPKPSELGARFSPTTREAISKAVATDTYAPEVADYAGFTTTPVAEPYCGANLDGKGGCSFTVWAPAAKEAYVFLYKDGEAMAESRRVEHMRSEGNGFMRVEVDGVEEGQLYHFGLKTNWDAWFERRDPYARATQANTSDSVSCIVVDPTSSWAPWETPPAETQVMYQLHVPSFTGYNDPESAGVEGTFQAAFNKLDHIADCGFTAIQLMPVLEFSGSWGYNPRLLFPTHQACGTPHELRCLVNESHKRGLSVFFDAVLHHGAAKDNSLWNYDGWEEGGNGGIYHEGGGPTGFGTSFSFWKEEVKQMLYDSCAMYFREYNADGLRIDAAHLLPNSLIKYLTFKLRQDFPNKLIIAEMNPFEPGVIHDLGFDTAWDFDSYFSGLAYIDATQQLDLNRIKSLLSLKPGLSHPTQAINFLLGSHDQIGCRSNGGHNHETNMIHRHGVHHLGGRGDWEGRARARMWYAMQCTAQGIPMSFMGTEVMHDGFWHIDHHNRFNWDFAGDEVGQQSMEATRAINELRAASPALGRGSINFVHEDHHNGVLAFERVSSEPFERLLVVVNTGGYQNDDASYGVNCGCDSTWTEVYNSQDEPFGGWEGSGNRGRGLIQATDGHLHLRLPKLAVMVFAQVE